MATTLAPPVDVASHGDLDEFERFCLEEVRLDDKRPLVLEPFQRALLADYFGGTRETLVLIPKKNGKTSLIAALVLYHLLVVPDAAAFVAASSGDQARILFDQASKYVRRSRALAAAFSVKPGLRELRARHDGGLLRVLAADAGTADGVIPTLAIVDELHRHKSPDLYGVLSDGLGPRDGRIITISTAGDDIDTPLGAMRANALKLPLVARDPDLGAYRRCASDDASQVMHEWSLEVLDGSPDVDDLAVVKLANPASWHTHKKLFDRQHSTSMTRWRWARFACGIWMAGEDSAVAPEEWGACRDPESVPATLSAVAQRVIAVDVGWKWDATAIVPVGLTDAGRVLVPEPTIMVPPQTGEALRIDDIVDAIVRQAQRHDCKTVVIDPMRGGESVAELLERDHDLDVVAYAQDPAPMAIAAERLIGVVRESTLTHTGHKLLTDHVLAAVPKTVGEGRFRFTKSKRLKRHIDGLIAMTIGVSALVGGLLDNQRSVYEDRDLEIW